MVNLPQGYAYVICPFDFPPHISKKWTCGGKSLKKCKTFPHISAFFILMGETCRFVVIGPDLEAEKKAKK